MTTRILRERYRPVWRRKDVLAACGAAVVALGVGGVAWHRGGAVPVAPITMALPDSEIGEASSSDGIGG